MIDLSEKDLYGQKLSDVLDSLMHETVIENVFNSSENQTDPKW